MDLRPRWPFGWTHMRSFRYRLGILFLILLGASVGCDRNVAPFDPSEVPREPDLRSIFPASEEARSPMGARAAALPGELANSVESSGSAASVRGEVHLAEGIRPSPGAVLFIIARKRGSQGGPPLAVARIGEPRFPQPFELGPDQVMIPSLRFEGPVSITARLDADGNAMTREASNPVTASSEPAEPGQTGLLLRLESPPSP